MKILKAERLRPFLGHLQDTAIPSEITYTQL